MTEGGLVLEMRHELGSGGRGSRIDAALTRAMTTVSDWRPGRMMSPISLIRRDMRQGSEPEPARVSGHLSRMLASPGDAAAIFARGGSRSGATGVSRAETDDTRALTRSNAGSVKWNHHCGRDG